METDGPRVILGLGTGRCGTHSLMGLLNRQPEASFTHEDLPHLPWDRRPGNSGIADRLRRFRETRPGRHVGDISTFYLPYAEEAIALDPRIRMICLERPRDEFVASFVRWLDTLHPLPTDNWSRHPAPGFEPDPFWSRIFPKYEVSDREAGLRLYWDEYRARAAELAARYLRQFRIFATEAFNSPSDVREILSFAGIPRELQVIEAGVRGGRSDRVAIHARRAIATSAPPDDPRQCVVLVPYLDAIHPACEDGLRRWKAGDTRSVAPPSAATPSTGSAEHSRSRPCKTAFAS